MGERSREHWLSRLMPALIAGLALAGCEPVFETRTIYVPPETREARQCVVEARSDREACLSEAQARYDDCRAAQLRAAEPGFHWAQEQFAFDRQVYFQCRNSALNEIALLNDQREAECRRLAEGGAPCAPGDGFIADSWAIDRFVDRRCQEPEPPELDDFLDLSRCGAPDGACVPNYNRAYTACGGEVRTIQDCVANCD